MITRTENQSKLRIILHHSLITNNSTSVRPSTIPCPLIFEESVQYYRFIFLLPYKDKKSTSITRQLTQITNHKSAISIQVHYAEDPTKIAGCKMSQGLGWICCIQIVTANLNRCTPGHTQTISNSHTGTQTHTLTHLLTHTHTHTHTHRQAHTETFKGTHTNGHALYRPH